METTATNNIQTEKTTKKDMYMIDPRNIKVQKGFNSRVNFDLEDLVKSIKVNGVLNPISVIPEKDENGQDKYRLVDGERRYRATMQAIAEGADIKRIPALFLSKSLTEEELIIQQIVRNEGKPFNEYEYGIACRKLRDIGGYTPKQMSEHIGKCEGQISYFLEHLERDSYVQELLRTGRMSGAEVRRIYGAHKDKNGVIDEKGAVAEIKQGESNAKKNGKSKITLKDLNTDGKTITSKDSKTIKAGIAKFIEYYSRYSNDGEIEINLDIMDVLEKLSDGMLIDEIFEEQIKVYRKAE